MLILCNPPVTEFDYQALDYCKLFSAFIEPSAVSEKAEIYLGIIKTANAAEVRNMPILAFRQLTPADLKQIDDSNKIFYFSNGNVHASAILFASAIDSFVTFGGRSAYKVANSLRNADVDKPVRKIFPWTPIDGINKYESPPIGKIFDHDDIGLRAVFRLMAAGAIVLAPNISPFSDIIINKWNGMLISGEITNDIINNIAMSTSHEQANLIANRAKEITSTIMDRTSYISSFTELIINGKGFDHNEPWTRVSIKQGTSWIILKQDMEEGKLVQTPARFRDTFKQIKPLDIEQLLDYLVPMRFKDVYVFDALIEDISDAKKSRILRLLSILGDRAKSIFFCMDEPPKQWHNITHRLLFMPVSEGFKRVN